MPPDTKAANPPAANSGTYNPKEIDPNAPPKPKVGAAAALQGGVHATVKKSTRGNEEVGAIDKVTAWPGKSGNAMRIIAPGMEADATVKLRDDVDPDSEQIYVGWTQIVDSSQRIAIYRVNGKVDGAKVITLPAMTRDGKKSVEAPWYGTPVTVDKLFRSAEAHAEDQPNFNVSTKIKNNHDQDALLSEVSGSDNFTITLKAGPNSGSLTALQSFTWHVPWATKVADPNAKSFGGGDLGIADAKADNRTPKEIAANEAGKEAGAVGVGLFGDVPAAVAALQDMEISAYLQLMEKHKGISSESYWNMVGALWKSQAKFNINISARAGKTAGGDEFKGDRKRTYGLSCNGKQAVVGEREAGRFSVLAHTVYDPASVGPGQWVSLMVNGMSQANISWPFGKETTSLCEDQEAGIFGTKHYGFTVTMSLSK